MKRTSLKNKQLELKRRLELVRTTVRELTSTELGLINGGADTKEGCQDATGLLCCYEANTRVSAP